LTLSISGLGSKSQSLHFFRVLPLQTKWDIMTTMEQTDTYKRTPCPSLSKRCPNAGTLCEMNDTSLLGVSLIGCLLRAEVTGHHFPVAYIKVMTMGERRFIVTLFIVTSHCKML